MSLRRDLFYILMVIFAAFIFVTEEFNPFAFWNMLPILVAFGIYGRWRQNAPNPRRYPAFGCLIGAMLLIVPVHIAWLFDIGGFASGSSTSGITFLFLPFFALVPAVIGCIVAMGIDQFKNP